MVVEEVVRGIVGKASVVFLVLLRQLGERGVVGLGCLCEGRAQGVGWIASLWW
jgi:hypothetical protein